MNHDIAAGSRRPARRRHSVLLPGLLLVALAGPASPARVAGQAPSGPRGGIPSLAAQPWSASPAAPAEAFRQQRSYTVAGAVAGAVIGAGATALFVYSGDSTSLCDRDRNQDAIGPRECAAIIAGGGLVGAGIGALIGSRIRRDVDRNGLRFGVTPSGTVGMQYRMRF